MFISIPQRQLGSASSPELAGVAGLTTCCASPVPTQPIRLGNVHLNRNGCPHRIPSRGQVLNRVFIRPKVLDKLGRLASTSVGKTNLDAQFVGVLKHLVLKPL